MAQAVAPGNGAAQAAAEFERHRRRLFGIAYRMLGSVSEAEDVVQDCYVRWHQADRAAVGHAGGFLAAMATRLAIDVLRSARRRREEYFGDWLPEPLVTGWVAGADAAHELADSLSMAFLLLLERLSPEQRAVYVLREALDMSYEDIAAILGRSPAGCRQAFRRAKARLGAPSRIEADPAQAAAVAQAFAAASAAGDHDGLVRLFADDAVLIGDGGGKGRSVINRIRGPERIARFFRGLRRKYGDRLDLRPLALNGAPGFALRVDGELRNVVVLQVEGGRIRALFQVANPDKLAHVIRLADA